MITVRQIERLWSAKAYEKLFEELVAARPEGLLRLEMDRTRSAAAAAMAIIRLEELSQSHVPLFSRLVRSILAGQEADGGWGDLTTTALCLRALLAGQGQGIAIEQGMFYLANLQKQEGIWPKIPIRRMNADPYVSAFILFELGENLQFRSAVRFLDAVNWFEANQSALDAETRRLWDRASVRCQLRRPMQSMQDMMWS